MENVQVKRILFPVDLSKNSSKILPFVLSVSEKYNALIYLLHVVEDLSQWGSGLYVPHLPLSQFEKDALKGAEKALDKVCKKYLKSCSGLLNLLWTMQALSLNACCAIGKLPISKTLGRRVSFQSEPSRFGAWAAEWPSRQERSFALGIASESSWQQ